MKEKTKKYIIRIIGILLALLTIISTFSGILYVFAEAATANKYVTVTKEILAKDINWENGNPIFVNFVERKMLTFFDRALATMLALGICQEKYLCQFFPQKLETFYKSGNSQNLEYFIKWY